MVATSIIPLNGHTASVVDAAVASLVTSETLNGRYRIGLPVALCTGTLVDVSVLPEPDGRFMVSDDGAAHFEIASAAFNIRTFTAVARAKCTGYGALFDGGTTLVMRVPAERLRGAIISMASLIKEVVDETVERAVRARAESDRDVLFHRLDSAFPGDAVRHDAEIRGASTFSYRVDALVQTEAGPVIFDLFTRDPLSIAATFTKLSDIHRLDTPPGLVAVTRDPDSVGPKLQLISSVAPVVRLTSDPGRFRKAAA